MAILLAECGEVTLPVPRELDPGTDFFIFENDPAVQVSRGSSQHPQGDAVRPQEVKIDHKPWIFQAVLEEGAADGRFVSRFHEHAEVIADLKAATKTYRGKATNGVLVGGRQSDQPAVVAEGDDVQPPFTKVVPPGVLPNVREEYVVLGGALRYISDRPGVGPAFLYVL